LDEEINTEQSILPFRLRLRRFPEKEISRIEEENLLPFFFYLVNQCRFLSDPAKRIPESAARLHLSHHIIGVDNTKMGFGGSQEQTEMG
jgi:hypothetical protein